MVGINTCYECGKQITKEDQIYFDDADLCKKCHYNRDEEEEKPED